ncbi:hypothetical protein HG15A2_21460 [Adhaeretor mobilis]|uniref:Uncharacterized protein n=1 Tax=Adhaeretor mobilis TaxID=1930276 RepID=A0A517MVE9_9BACT|nr:hypothetical protein HG15A2_21460 [Adhaeretor mobilis]
MDSSQAISVVTKRILLLALLAMQFLATDSASDDLYSVFTMLPISLGVSVGVCNQLSNVAALLYNTGER